MDYYLIYKDGEILGYSNFPVFEDGAQCYKVAKEEYDVYKNNLIKKQQIQYQIDDLKDKLKETDWVVIKINEMETEEEKQDLRNKYANILTERKQWREEINKLEKEEV